jgi:integrase
MAVDDTWYLAQKVEGKRVPSAKHGRGRRWRVRYRDDTGAPTEKLFHRQADAEAFDAEVRTDVARGQYVDPELGRTTLAQFAERWRGNQIHRASTADRVETAFRLHVDPILGRLKLAEVRRSHVQAWVKDRTAVLAPSTLALVYRYLVGVFTAAVDDRAIATSPCHNIKLPEVDHDERVIPTPAQVYALADALPGWMSGLVWPAAGCGLRLGETWGLELEHVDFMHREIHVVQQLAPGGYIGPPKTRDSRRSVEMGTVVAEKLARHLELHPPRTVSIEDRTDPRRPVTREATLVFTTPTGRPVIRGAPFNQPWNRAATAAGAPDLTYHGLRHYFATALIHRGASVKTVQKALGHSRPSITLDTYTHDWPDALDRIRNLVDDALSDPRAQFGPNSGRLA